MRDRKVCLRKEVMALSCIVSGATCIQTLRNVNLRPEEKSGIELFIRDIGQRAIYLEVMEVLGKDKIVQERLQERMTFSKTSKIYYCTLLGMVVHMHNTNTLEPEAGGLLQFRLDLNSKFQTSQGYIKTLCQNILNFSDCKCILCNRAHEVLGTHQVLFYLSLFVGTWLCVAAQL